MILILAGLELTSNDVQSRFSRTQQLSMSAPRFRLGNATATTEDTQLTSLGPTHFASMDSTFSKRKSGSVVPIKEQDDPEIGETKTILIRPPSLNERTDDL